MRKSIRVFFDIGVLLPLVLLPSTAHARLISRWTLERIAKEAEVLVVGEVLDVATVGSIPRGETRWRAPLFRKKARVRVLRFVLKPGSTGLVENQEIDVEFYGIDWERGGSGVNGPHFPDISAGDVTVFPLRRTAPAETKGWELLDEEDFGLLVPALRNAPAAGRPESLLDFLRLELAGVLSGGSRRDIHRAAKYLASAGGSRGESLRALVQLVSDEVKGDEARWLSLAVACYCVSGVPRPKLSDLKTSAEGARPELTFAVEALDRIRGELTIDRFIVAYNPTAHPFEWTKNVVHPKSLKRHYADL